MLSKKVTVYVRHYLTSAGINYFQQEWFPWVYSIISQQKGFIFITHKFSGLCANICLQFEDEATFDAWLLHPSHDCLVDALDDYRDRDYWEVVRTSDEQADLSQLEWINIKPKKQGLNPREKEFGETWEAARTHSGKLLHQQTLDELRAGTLSFLCYAGKPADVKYEDREISARDGFPLSIRIFNSQLSQETPVLIFYPGCGFIFDLFEVNSIIGSRIAFFSGIKVILVQFRLAPEYPMPMSIYDGYDAAAYVASHSENFGVDPNQLLLGGWCSGAQCAAAVSHLAHQKGPLKVYHQILLGGSYDLTNTTHDFDDYEQQDKILSRKFIEHIASRYYGIQPRDHSHPLISPYHAANCTGLPPTTILCGEYDALRNDFRRLFSQIKAERCSCREDRVQRPNP